MSQSGNNSGERDLNESTTDEAKRDEEIIDEDKREEEIIEGHCNHIYNFVETLSQSDLSRFSRGVRQKIAQTQNKLKEFLALDSRVHSSGNDSTPIDRSLGGRRDEVLGDGYMSSDRNDSMLKMLVKNIDNRRSPELKKFDEKSGECLKTYIKKFEKYCNDNIKGNQDVWIDEMANKLQGNALEYFESLRGVQEDYSEIKNRMLKWYEEVKEHREEEAKMELRRTKCKRNESLLIYSNRLEKIFRKAYPKVSVQTSKSLIDKFRSSIPEKSSKHLTELMFFNSLTVQAYTWEDVQKFARKRDLWYQTRMEEDSETEDENEITVNMNKVKGQKKMAQAQGNKYETRRRRVKVQSSSEDEEGRIRNTREKKTTEVTEDTSGFREMYYDPKKEKYFIEISPTKYSLADLPMPPAVHFGAGGPARRQGDEDRYKQKVQYDSQTGPTEKSSRGQTRGSSYSNFRSPPRNVIRCYTCGRIGHMTASCRETRCYACGRQGHIIRDCRQKQSRGRGSWNRPYSRTNRGTNDEQNSEN